MPQHIGMDAQWLQDRLEGGLQILLLATKYAELDQVPADAYAVCQRDLDSQGIIACDLHWLLSRCFVSHWIEQTMPGDATRSFRPGGVSFNGTSCFALTAAGVTFANRLLATRASREDESSIVEPSKDAKALDYGHDSTTKFPLAPRWDSERQELWYEDMMIKRYRLPSPNQTAILSAFQEDDWPARIDDPLPPKAEQDPKRRLHDTIRNLNRSHRKTLIRFAGDGSGQGVIWEKA